jgi:hypothetical protein
MKPGTTHGTPARNGTTEIPLPAQLAAWERIPVAQLRAEYARLFGEATAAHNRVWLVRRIAWRLQALAEGDLSERARQRAAELAQGADLRSTPPRPDARPARKPSDATPARRSARLPAGTVLTRPYKGAVLEVVVLEQGFRFQDAVYRSLSAVAQAVTGSHCSGPAFFRLRPQGDAP